MEQTSTERIHGLDIIRLVSFFAIATFHISLIHYHTPDIAIANQSIIIRIVEQIARLLSFSGFTIAFLTSLLTAISSSKIGTRVRLFFFLIFGWFVFSALMQKPADMLLVWDIYPLLFSGILSATIVEKYLPKQIGVLGIIGFCLLCVPFWDLVQFSDRNISDVYIVLGLAPCEVSGIEWPVLPWIGLTWMGYAIGNAAKEFKRKSSSQYLNVKWQEGSFWLAILAASTLGLGGFYQIKLGGKFSCEAYRQPPLVWWSHFVWVIFFIRLSFDPRIQKRLAETKIAQAISDLAISRKFWLAYFLNYLLSFVLSWIVVESGVEKTEFNIPVIATIAVCFLPLTEIVTRLAVTVFSKAIHFSKKDR